MNTAQTYITVSSCDRNSGTSSNFNVQFQRINIGQDKHTIKLISASIPLSFYSINSKNNGIVIDGLTYYLTPSKYSSSAFTIELMRIFVLHNAADASTANVSTGTGKLTIIPSDDYVLNGSNPNFTLWEVLGIVKGVDVNLITSTAYETPNLVHLIGVSRFHVRLPTLISRSHASYPGFPNDYVSSIEVTENHLNFGIEKHQPHIPPKLEINAVILQDMHIILVDQSNQEVDLNGVNTSFSFVVEKIMQ